MLIFQQHGSHPWHRPAGQRGCVILSFKYYYFTSQQNGSHLWHLPADHQGCVIPSFKCNYFNYLLWYSISMAPFSGHQPAGRRGCVISRFKYFYLFILLRDSGILAAWLQSLAPTGWSARTTSWVRLRPPLPGSCRQRTSGTAFLCCLPFCWYWFNKYFLEKRFAIQNWKKLKCRQNYVRN